MPLSRYQIRNEYSLADPELYKAADKDDPEALLEGVAMAGLVGVLRQLGDLAEFAAEIFHDLHEEVMVTAARGHALMVRVQQLEEEFPTIEKAFLSQTDHSSFFYNPGIDWHRNMQVDQNLITQGDLPRFIMDSYEECRGPPRLFLLDKFDVAGAGACLKRYTDPSFFKVETASFGTARTDVQREKKARKAKKKGSRWRNGETPDALSTSHAKLHQLFLEERRENGIADPARRAKLKRRLNGFPFHSKSGKSYMEKFLKSPSPDHKEVREIPVDSSPLALPSNSNYEPGFEIVEISGMSPEKESKQRSIIQSLSTSKEWTDGELSINELNVIASGNEILEVLEEDPSLGAFDISDRGLEAYEIPSTLHKADNEEDIAVDEQSKADDSINDYQSDDIASEIDNYMDALTILESEMDTDSDIKIKNDMHYLNSSIESTELHANAEQLQAHSSDSQSVGNSTLSDDGNSLLKKDISSFSYADTHSTFADNTPSDGEISSNVFPSTEIHEPEIIDASLSQQLIGKEDPVSQTTGSVVCDDATVEAAKTPEQITELGEPTSSSSPPHSPPAFRSAEALVDEGTLVDTESDQLPTNHCNSTLCDASQPKEEDSPARFSGGNQHMDQIEVEDNNTSENLPGISYHSVPSYTKDDFPLEISAGNQLVDELNDEGLNLDEDVACTPSLAIDSPRNNDENPPMFLPEMKPLGEFHSEFPIFNENASLASSLSDVPFPDGVSAENLSRKELGVTDPNSILDALVPVSNATEVAADKKINDNSVDSAPEIGNMEEHHVQNSDDNHVFDQNPVMLPPGEQAFNQNHYSGMLPVDTVSGVEDVEPPAGGITLNLKPREDSSCEFDEAFFSKTIVGAAPVKSTEEGSSYFREDHIDESSDTGDGRATGKASCNMDLLERDSTEEPSFLAASHVHLDRMDNEPPNVAVDFAGPDSNGIEAMDGSSADHRTLQEVSLSSSEGEHIASRTTEACFLDRPRELSIPGDAEQQKLVLVNDNHPTEVLGDVSEAKDTLNLDNSSTMQSSSEQNEQEPLLPEKKVEPLSEQLAETLLNAREAKSESLTKLQQTQLSDHTDHEGLDASSKSLLADLPSQSSLSLLPLRSNKIGISEQPINPSCSISSNFSLLPDANQIYVEEVPPMPPLPPVQWRMGRLQHALPAREEVFMQQNAGPFPPVLLSKDHEHTRPLNPFLHQPVLRDEKSLVGSGQPSVVQLGEVNDHMPPLEGIQFRDTFLPLSPSDGEMQQNHFHSEENENEDSRLISNLSDEERPSPHSLGLLHEEIIKPLNQLPAESGLKEELVQNSALSGENAMTYHTTAQPSKVGNEQPQEALPDSAHSSGLSSGELMIPMTQVVPETSMKDNEIGQGSGNSEENLVTCDITSLPSMTENKQPYDKTTLGETLAWPASEDNKPNGHRSLKVPRPRNPLIDAVAAHDKSKLRKVTERVRPQIQKEDEKDSLLEQIRTKSFNLKPAVVSRPSIQGPQTNLKVTAILEKAKAIRQAFAGSDEDDEDGWSDS